MKLSTLLLASATGMIATGLAVWSVVEPAPPRAAAASSTTSAPGAGLLPELPADPGKVPAVPAGPDRSRFQVGKTLMMEGRLGHAVLPAEIDSQTFLFVDVSADAVARAQAAVPINLSIVMDRSGSMKGKRMDNALAAARSAISRLRDGDVVSVVTYNTEAQIVVAPTMIDARSRISIADRLKTIRAAGDTCISCGLDTGMSVVGARPGMVSKILLLSDGLATAGIRDVAGFRRISDASRRMGASITTIGVDVDYDERILAALARDSNGRHFFVGNTAGLPAILDQEMASLTRTVANQAELVVDLAPGVVAEQIFDRVTSQRAGQVIVPLGAFTAGDHKTMLIRLRVPRGAAGDRPIAAVRLRYDDLVDNRPGTCEGDLIARISADPSQVAPLDAMVSARVSSSETAAALEDANELFRTGRVEEARTLLETNTRRLNDRRRDARKLAPAADKADLDMAFAKQEKALGGAGRGFDPTPVAEPAAPASAAPPTAGTRPPDAKPAPRRDRERAAKEQTRANQEAALDLGI